MRDDTCEIQGFFGEHGNRILWRITVNPHRERRYREPFDAILIGEPDRAFECLRKMPGRVWIFVVFGAARVDDPTGRELKPRRNHRLPQFKRREAPRVGLELWSRSAINGAANAATRDQIFVRRIDEGIAIELPHDVPLDYGNLRAGCALTK